MKYILLGFLSLAAPQDTIKQKSDSAIITSIVVQRKLWKAELKKHELQCALERERINQRHQKIIRELQKKFEPDGTSVIKK